MHELHVRRRHVMECERRITPLLPPEALAKSILLPDRLGGNMGPGPGQSDPSFSERHAQHAIARPFAIGHLLPMLHVFCVIVRNSMHCRIGNNEARSTVCKSVFSNLHLVAKIQLARRVKVLQPPKQIRPDWIGVRLEEDVPLHIWAERPRLLDHRQELPFVQLPARVIHHPRRAVGDLLVILIGQCVATTNLGAIV